MDRISITNQQIDSLFNAKTIAIVGLPRGMKTGTLYLIALRDLGYQGRIVGVNPGATEIDGVDCYPSVMDIPGDVDLAIVLTPHAQTMKAIQECTQKGVKGVILFTAGYRESGTEEGARQQEDLVEIAGQSGMRIIGPNGMGLYSPESGVSFFPKLSRQSGPISLISHSGSLANIICGIGASRGLFFNKAVSLGNECDLSTADFLHYFADDPKTDIISAYVEGISDGPSFKTALLHAARKKPVIIWKVGLNPSGLAAANSHTGALSSPREIWEGLVAQSGVIPVSGFEMWSDTMTGFALLPEPPGDRMAVISGPGGLAVAAAEACGRENLRLAKLSDGTRTALARVVPPTGTSLKNPVDVGLTASLEIDIYIKSIQSVARDDHVDAVLIIGIGLTEESNDMLSQAIINTQRETQKPFLIVEVPNVESDFSKSFLEAGIPFFPTSERALAAYASVLRYYRRRDVITQTGI